jgi:hypothetical protein
LPECLRRYFERSRLASEEVRPDMRFVELDADG